RPLAGTRAVRQAAGDLDLRGRDILGEHRVSALGRSASLDGSKLLADSFHEIVVTRTNFSGGRLGVADRGIDSCKSADRFISFRHSGSPPPGVVIAPAGP